MKKLISAFLIVTMLMSVVCVSVAADGSILINENFASYEGFLQNFIAGAYYVEDGVLFGYKEARTFQTLYDDSQGVFADSNTTWLTYDSSVEIAIGEDDFGDVEDRHVSVSYCNDNLFYEGRSEGRVFYNFNYSVPTSSFTLTAGGVGEINEEVMLLPAVVNENVCTDGSEFFTLGMSVGKGHIRCFYNGELVFDYVDTANEHLIGHVIESPYLFWNTNNFVQVKNITIATEGYLFPYPVDPIVTDPIVTDPIGDETEATEATETEESETTTRIDTEIVTNDDGETEIVTQIVTEAPVVDNDDNGGDAADTVNTTANAGPSTNTGDVTFAIVAAMVAALGSALIVKKVRG